MAHSPIRRSRDTEFHLMRKDLDALLEGMKEIHKLVTSEYVSKSEFNPVQSIVYGAVKLVLGSVALSLLALVLAKTGAI